MTARAIGINHVALPVGDIDEALEFYGKLFEFRLRGRNEHGAFIDLGDQFIALAKTDIDRHGHQAQHFGLVVDDRETLKEAMDREGIKPMEGGFLDILDPWGNRIQIVVYEDIQFLKAPEVLAAMGAGDLRKTQAAREELRAKGVRLDRS